MRITHISRIIGVLSLALLVSGCTVGQFHRMGPQSHFSYPNSNVKTVGPVKVELRGTSSWLTPLSFMTSEIDQRVFNAAIAQADGADLITDYIRTTTIKKFLGIYWTTEYLEGTAARMEIGKQHLR